jgi:hypothetical protein
VFASCEQICQARANARGIFPSALSCLEIPSANYALQTAGEGRLRLVLPSTIRQGFHAIQVAGGAQRDLGTSATTRIYVDYTNTQITVSLDPTSAQPWSFEQTGLAIVQESDGSVLKTSRGTIFADNSTAPRFTLKSDEFGETLAQVKPIMPFFSSGLLGGVIPSEGITRPLNAVGEPKERSLKIGLKLKTGIPENIFLFIGHTGDNGSIEVNTDLTKFFSLEAKILVRVFDIFPADIYFKYEVEVLNSQ